MQLNIQGIEDSRENYVYEYNRLHKKLNLHLPEFYFSVRPNYYFERSGYDNFERKFIDNISIQKFSKSYISNLIVLINKAPEATRKKLFYSINLKQLKDKLSIFEAQLPPDLKTSLTELIDSNSSHQIRWHYPVINFHGFENQYHKWVQNILKGDFGDSLLDARPVTDKLWDALKWSSLLLFLGLFFLILFAFPLGVYNGMRPNSVFDNISNSLLFAFYAVPKFWMATLMIIFFTTAEYGAWTNIFPSVGIWYPDGATDFFTMLAKSWHKLILPMLILVIPDVAFLSRLIRSNVQEESNKEYVKTALSKGMSIRDITVKHILPNSLIPTITLLVGAIPGALASALIVEVIFNIPGIGRLIFESIQNADWAMVYPIVLVISVFSVILFLLGDILMALVNPKINLGS